MADRVTKFLGDTEILVDSDELADVVGIDRPTVDNWLRRGVISRAKIGARNLRSRVFSTDEVYKTGLIVELVSLGILPSPASDAVNEVWKDWDKKEISDGKNIYGIISPLDEKWSVLLCWQKLSGGPLYKLGKSSSSEAEEIEFPKSAFAVIPISEVVAHVAKKLAELLNDANKRTAK